MFSFFGRGSIPWPLALALGLCLSRCEENSLIELSVVPDAATVDAEAQGLEVLYPVAGALGPEEAVMLTDRVRDDLERLFGKDALTDDAGLPVADPDGEPPNVRLRRAPREEP